LFFSFLSRPMHIILIHLARSFSLSQRTAYLQDSIQLKASHCNIKTVSKKQNSKRRWNRLEGQGGCSLTRACWGEHTVLTHAYQLGDVVLHRHMNSKIQPYTGIWTGRCSPVHAYEQEDEALYRHMNRRTQFLHKHMNSMM
jgi:hypothetical protein